MAVVQIVKPRPESRDHHLSGNKLEVPCTSKDKMAGDVNKFFKNNTSKIYQYKKIYMKNES